jgi:beta-phosphoglucomutase-like phosphatase (HAD superfamily)
VRNRLSHWSLSTFGCVASSSWRDSIEACLAKFELCAAFEELFSATELKRGKLRPDVFLEAARQMQIEPSDAVVVEDSVPDLRAAEAAGMKCIVCPDTSLPEPAERCCGAPVLVTSLAELTIETIRTLGD